jgi:hypothetical protein
MPSPIRFLKSNPVARPHKGEAEAKAAQGRHGTEGGRGHKKASHTDSCERLSRGSSQGPAKNANLAHLEIDVSGKLGGAPPAENEGLAPFLSMSLRDVLDWERIPCAILKIDSLLAGEYAENELRKQFTPSERAAIGKAIEEQEPQKMGRPKVGAIAPTSEKGKTADIAEKHAHSTTGQLAAAAGVSPKG